MASLLYELLNAIKVHQRDWRASLYTGTGKASPLYAFSCVSGEPQSDWRTCHTSRTEKGFSQVCILVCFWRSPDWLNIYHIDDVHTVCPVCALYGGPRGPFVTCLFRSLDCLNRFPQWSHFKGLPPVRDSSGTLGDWSNCHDLSSIQSHS